MPFSDIFCTKSAMRENADPKGAVVVILLEVSEWIFCWCKDEADNCPCQSPIMVNNNLTWI